VYDAVATSPYGAWVWQKETRTMTSLVDLKSTAVMKMKRGMRPKITAQVQAPGNERQRGPSMLSLDPTMIFTLVLKMVSTTTTLKTSVALKKKSRSWQMMP
jgi:hypothetical protein